MLKSSDRSLRERAAGVWGPSGDSSLKAFPSAIRRQLPTFITVVATFVVIGLVYLHFAVPRFTATASMVIDTRHVQLFQKQSVLNDETVDAGTVQTQIELIKSINVSSAVIKSEHLIDDPEFVGTGGRTPIDSLMSLFGFQDRSSKPTDVQLARAALAAFESRRTVGRVSQSYVMEVGFESADREKASRIANAIVDAYINDQLEGKYQATKRASLWLQDRLKELRAQASAAQKAVVDFKNTNNIVDTGGPGGRLMSDQQLSEVNSQLIMANATTAEAKAKYDRIQQIMKEPIPDESVTDALKSEVIIKLRQQYLDLAQKAAIWAERYGPNHLATVNLRTQMLELRHSITDEMQKIAQSYKSDYQIAQARETSIKNSLSAAVSTSQTSNQAQVQLRELDSSAQSYRSLYDNFLQRYMEVVQQQSFPITEARLIGPAPIPLTKSSPKTFLILLLTAFLGIGTGVAAALAREAGDRVFRLGEQVEAMLQVNCLAIIPRIKELVPSQSARAAKPIPTGASAKIQKSFYGYVVNAPFSPFAEGLRSVKMAMDISGVSRTRKVVAFTSTSPREGKSTVSANFAQMIAHGGARVVLVDADLRNPTLSRNFGPVKGGLINVLAGHSTLDESITLDPVSGISFLPAGLEIRTPHTNELLASTAMKDMIEDLRSRYDYVILDLPPLLPVVDARATTAYVDSYIYVIEWGQTKKEAVRHALASAPELYENILGVILNKADMAALVRYDHTRKSIYDNKYYAQYGYASDKAA